MGWHNTLTYWEVPATEKISTYPSTLFHQPSLSLQGCTLRTRCRTGARNLLPETRGTCLLSARQQPIEGWGRDTKGDRNPSNALQVFIQSKVAVLKDRARAGELRKILLTFLTFTDSLWRLEADRTRERRCRKQDKDWMAKRTPQKLKYLVAIKQREIGQGL